MLSLPHLTGAGMIILNRGSILGAVLLCAAGSAPAAVIPHFQRLGFPPAATQPTSPLKGMRPPPDGAPGLGLDLTGWKLTDVAGISADGGTLTGTGINPAGRPEAWVAVVPEPAGLALLTGAASLVLRRRARLTREPA
jgi:hypothetical protein